MSEKQSKFRFDKMELAGSLGDLGTLLPLAVGMIVLNGLHATNVFIVIGLFYIIAGLYFGVPIAVQPMKVIGAYAVAVGLTPLQIVSSSIWMGVLILFLGSTGLIRVVSLYTPKSTIRGVQLGVGVVLLIKGFKLILTPDPNLSLQHIGPIGTGLILGIAAILLTLLLLENRKLPAALVIILMGIAVSIFIGKPIKSESLTFGFHLPKIFPYGYPSWGDVIWVFPILVLPQLPMTIGNAIISNTDLMHEYFGKKAKRATYKSISNSQGLADVFSYFFGGIPMCHGAGGLAAHYRFGARTGGSNVIIGGICILLAILFGESIVSVLNLLPFSILGALLVFAGLQLALMIQDLRERKDLFVVLAMLGLALTSNLAIAFIAGILLANILKLKSVKV